MHNTLINFIRDVFNTNDNIPLHTPFFGGNEKNNITETIDSTFVSSVGSYVDAFESELAAFCQAPYSVAVVNGTAALQTALYLAGDRANDIVITQSLTFVATCNAIHWLGGEAAFVDVSMKTLGMCPNSLSTFLSTHCDYLDGQCIYKKTEQVVKAVVPMHTFGHPAEIDALAKICETWGIALVEDSAESLGSTFKGKSLGTFGQYGALSFNGNKIITTGGGGAILCKSEMAYKKIKHFTTTAKVPHRFEFFHDEVACNFRMPNLNAALGCAQLAQLQKFITNKRELASIYEDFLSEGPYTFVKEPEGCVSNYWLNAVICKDESQRDLLLSSSNDAGIMLRPVWTPMHLLPMYAKSIRGPLDNTEWLAKRLVNLPSSVRG